MSNGENEGVRRFFGSITPLQIVGVVIGIVAIVGILWIIFDSGNGRSNGTTNLLASSESARGLITICVAIVTVSIALILVLYVIMGTAGQDFKDRFTFGKDVLMVFVGILGTIMGYYYAEDKVSPGDISKIAAASGQEKTSPIVDLENKAFAALLGKDFNGALKAFGDAYAAFPGWHNVEAINNLLSAKKEDFSKAGDDAKKKEEIWQSIFCDISKNKKTLGMSKEMIGKVEAYCNGTETTEPSSANNSSTNTNTSPVR